MENNTEKLIDEQFAKLPTPMQMAIKAVPWKQRVSQIATVHSLPANQLESLEQETMLILYGFEKPEGYIDNLMQEMGIDENLATTIAEEVNEKIFKTISQKTEELEGQNTIPTQPSVPEIAPEIHPIIEEGEVAHDVRNQPTTHNEQPTTEVSQEKSQTPVPAKVIENAPKPENAKYPGGVDPYREPLG
jgi:hypothetical protein